MRPLHPVLVVLLAAPAVADEPDPTELAKLVQDVKDLAALVKRFEFHGYQRAGFGVNSEGGQQGAFYLPGAFAKYRLGNEAEVYGEYELDANWLNPDHDGAWFKTGFMWSVVGNRNGTFDAIPPGGTGIRAAYMQGGHLIDSQPDMSFWAGQRYYRRRDVHIMDFFYQNTSTFGGGFEELDVGVGRLAVAYLGMSDDSAVFDIGKLTRNFIDIRWYNIPIGGNKLEVWLLPSFGLTRPEGSHVPQNGIAAGAFFTTPLPGPQGINDLSVEFGFAGASDMGGNTFNTTTLSTAADDGWMLRVVDRAVFQVTPSISMMADGIFQIDNRLATSRGNIWGSVGARPVYMFTKYFGVTVEAGLDMVDPQAGDFGWLLKLTAAAVVRPGAAFFARPELRLFVTGGFWADAYKCAEATSTNCVGGGVGNPFAGDTAGATFGIQGESWW